MDAMWLASLALATVPVAAATAWLVRSRVRDPLRRRIVALDDELARERASARRRLDEAAREQKVTLARMYAALGLPAEQQPRAQAGRRFAASLVERVSGLSEVDAVTVADESGLSWVEESSEADASLAAAGGEALRVSLALDVGWRQVHVELADARHVVVRPLPGTFPRLALVTCTTSRPTSAFALDATVAFAAIASGAAVPDAGAGDTFAGHDHGPGTEGRGQVAQNLEAELVTARASCGARAMLVALGDDPLASISRNGPMSARLTALVGALRPLLGTFERRLGATGRRIELTNAAGSTVTFAPLGTAGRFGLLAVGAERPVDPAVVDRLIGRLRRFLPAPPALDITPRGVA